MHAADIDRLERDRLTEENAQLRKDNNTLRKDVDILRQTLKDQKLIQRAKGIIMDRNGMKESEAHRHLQKMARDNNKTVAEMANMIIVTERAVFGGAKQDVAEA